MSTEEGVLCRRKAEDRLLSGSRGGVGRHQAKAASGLGRGLGGWKGGVRGQGDEAPWFTDQRHKDQCHLVVAQ